MIEPVPSAIVGYRLWQVVPPFDRLLSLGFVGSGTTWQASEITAVCLLSNRKSHPHKAPVMDCSCGLYAWKTMDLMFDSYISVPDAGAELIGSRGMAAKPVIRGAIVAWGHIQEHELGFRAQHMRVVALLGSAGAYRIADRLEIPVLPTEEIETYAEWFGEPLTAQPLDR